MSSKKQSKVSVDAKIMKDLRESGPLFFKRPDSEKLFGIPSQNHNP